MPPKRNQKTMREHAAESSADQKDDGSSTKRLPRQAKMRQELDSLHQEMEVAQHGHVGKGQLRRKLPRAQSALRTRKRKMLEREDEEREAAASMNMNTSSRRLRGARAAGEDSVLQGSFVFGDPSTVNKV